MNDFFEEASEVAEIPYEGLTTPGTAFTSPWMEIYRSPDTCFVNTVTQTALPEGNANTYPDSTFINALPQAMSPTDKVNTWIVSTPAGPRQSSRSRPDTRDTALTVLGGNQSQFWNQNTGNAFFDTSATSPSARGLFQDPCVNDQTQLPTVQMVASTMIPGSSRVGTRDPFFDSVPTGPSQLSTLRRGAIYPAFNPRSSTGDQVLVSPVNKTESAVSPTERVREKSRTRLSLRTPNTSIDKDFQSAPQMATNTEIPDPQPDAPRTTESSVPAARPSTPGFQGPQRRPPRRGDMLNPAARPFQSKFSGSRGPARRTNHTLMQPTEVTHTNSRVWSSDSKVWSSDLVIEKERWQEVEVKLKGMNLLRSSVVPKSLKDWLAHQRGHADAKKEREQKRLDEANSTLRDPRLPLPGRPVKIGHAFRGRAFEHKNYSSVLVFPSVWARTYEAPPERLDPLWPCEDEKKEEGDERNTSGFRRFPALPRVPGNDTVQYKLKAIQPLLPFDAIWELPTKKSVEAANERYSPEDTEKMEKYLGRSLLDALDCITEDGF